MLSELGLVFEKTLSQLSRFAPSLVLFVVILVFGWLGALALRRFTKFILRRFKIEYVAEKLGIETFLLKGGVRYTTSTIISAAAYWIFLIFALLLGFNYLGLPLSDHFIGRLLEFVPRVVVSFVLFLLGLGAARALSAALLAYLNNLQVDGAPVIARVCRVTIVVFTVVVVLENLAIGGEVLVTTFLMAFGALCLAVGISFGLAGRKLAATILDKIFRP